MKTIIIYETKYGNTKKAAEAIGEGLIEAGHEIILRDVKEADINEIKDADVIVIGSPTYAGSHARGIKKFIKKMLDINMEGKSIVAFDTHSAGGEGNFLRKAVFKMEKQIQKTVPGIKIVMNGLQVGVHGIKGPLVDGELEKCKEFGKKIGSNL
ncbi:MAG: flavodoxin family protein [Promethearchaeota archaeon]|jgi:flavodoxin